jgi:hypothetical protein
VKQRSSADFDVRGRARRNNCLQFSRVIHILCLAGFLLTFRVYSEEMQSVEFPEEEQHMLLDCIQQICGYFVANV